MSINTSFSEVVGRMISVYQSLQGHIGNRSTGAVYLNESVDFLSQLSVQGELSPQRSSVQQITSFFRLYLDIAGIISTTEGTFEPITIGDVKSLGSKRDISGILSSGQVSIEDWICSILLQGWIRKQGPAMVVSGDLKTKLSKLGRNCDFRVTGIGIAPTLVECKRIHPLSPEINYETNISNMLEKILDKCHMARRQFENTESTLNLTRQPRVVVVDVAAYGYHKTVINGDTKILGLGESDEIAVLSEKIRNERMNGIDQIILTWTNTFLFEAAPMALAYYTSSLLPGGADNIPATIGYKGWTIEFYPTNEDPHKYLEFRISLIGWSLSSIKASWLSEMDRLVTFS